MKYRHLSIIMPALNEEENIHAALADTLQAFDDFNIDGEIIVINDGSTDNTAEIVKSIQKKDNRIRMIIHDTPRGIGASFWDGVDNSGKDFVCMLPGDNENDPWEIMRYCRLLEHVDIVIPFAYNKEMRSLFRNILSFIYRFVINTTFLVNLNYTNGTVIYRKSILNELNYRSNGFFFQTDILIRNVKKGYLFAEVPYRLGRRNLGRSKATSFPSLVMVVKGYIRLVRDSYFQKKVKIKRKFTEDSLTSQRHNNTENFSN
ncbi:glycosyltransferase family 2 protein [Candidatus Latescibacterota bacterium]